MKEKEITIVGHEHLLEEQDFARKFFAIIQSWVLRNSVKVAIFLDLLIPFTKRDQLSYFAKFIRTVDKSAEEQLKELMSYYKGVNAQYNILTINMNGMGCGKTKRSFEDQILNLIELKKKYPIRIYFHYEPTQRNSLYLLEKYGEHFAGVKIYTMMGHFVWECNKAFDWCADNGKNVILHTSPETPSYFKGSKKELRKRLKKNKYINYQSNIFTSKKELCRNFTNPIGYMNMLEQYATVNFNFAHLYGADELDKHINNEPSFTSVLIAGLRTYKNAYTDISYTCAKTKYQKHLNILLRINGIAGKLLYGTDFPMNTTNSNSQTDFTTKLIKNTGEENYRKISIDNHRRFNNEL